MLCTTCQHFLPNIPICTSSRWYAQQRSCVSSCMQLLFLLQHTHSHILLLAFIQKWIGRRKSEAEPVFVIILWFLCLELRLCVVVWFQSDYMSSPTEPLHKRDSFKGGIQKDKSESTHTAKTTNRECLNKTLVLTSVSITFLFCRDGRG